MPNVKRGLRPSIARKGVDPFVAVVGSANLDIVLAVSRRPVAGETIMGQGLQETAGGKGLNQALSAVRVASTTFIGSVGRDHAAQQIEEALDSAGVDVTYLVRHDMATGRAYIQVTPDGENSIIVLALANSAMSPTETLAALDKANPTLVLTQFEVPRDVTVAVAQWCRKTGVRLVLNPSPVQPIDIDAISNADPLIVNQVEAQTILGVDANDDQYLALQLADRFESVVLTAGSNGAFVISGGEIVHISGEQVRVVDTTGAGDAFAGTLAAHLAHGTKLVDSAMLANREAARIIQLTREAR